MYLTYCAQNETEQNEELSFPPQFCCPSSLDIVYVYPRMEYRWRDEGEQGKEKWHAKAKTNCETLTYS